MKLIFSQFSQIVHNQIKLLNNRLDRLRGGYHVSHSRNDERPTIKFKSPANYLASVSPPPPPPPPPPPSLLLAPPSAAAVVLLLLLLLFQMDGVLPSLASLLIHFFLGWRRDQLLKQYNCIKRQISLFAVFLFFCFFQAPLLFLLLPPTHLLLLSDLVCSARRVLACYC